MYAIDRLCPSCEHYFKFYIQNYFSHLVKNLREDLLGLKKKKEQNSNIGSSKELWI